MITSVYLSTILFLVLFSGPVHGEDLPQNDLERFDALQSRAREALDQGELRDALGYYENMQEIDPQNSHVFYNRGSVLLDLERYDEAVELFTTALEFHREEQDPAPIHFNRAIAWSALEEFDRALEDYDVVRELDPENARAKNNRGVVLRRLGEIQKAISSFEAARDLDPDYPDPVFHLGNIAYDRGDYELARMRYEETLEIDPDLPDARFNLGNAFYNSGRYRDAVAVFVELYSRDPGDEDVVYNLGLSALAAATGEIVRLPQKTTDSDDS